MVVVGCQPLTGESMRWIKDTVSGLANPHDAAARNRVGKVRWRGVRGERRQERDQEIGRPPSTMFLAASATDMIQGRTHTHTHARNNGAYI